MLKLQKDVKDSLCNSYERAGHNHLIANFFSKRAQALLNSKKYHHHQQILYKWVKDANNVMSVDMPPLENVTSSLHRNQAVLDRFSPA